MKPRHLVAALATFAVCGTTVMPTLSAHAATGGVMSLDLGWTTHHTVDAGSAGPERTATPYPFAGVTIANLYGDSRRQVVIAYKDGTIDVVDGRTGHEMPGWPQSTHGVIQSNPTVADLYNDGREEIITGNQLGWVYVFNFDGTVAPGFPVTTKPVAMNVNPGIFSSIAVGDLFHDGHMELVASAWSQQVLAWDSSGHMLPGFPIKMWDTSWSTPALVDLTGTGKLDIVVGFDSSGPPTDPYPAGGEMWAFPPTGCPTGQYPTVSNCMLWVHTLIGQTPWASPVAADFNHDGGVEIAAGNGSNFPGGGNYAYMWNAAGQDLQSFPSPEYGSGFSSPSVGDLFGDGHDEVVQLSSSRYLYAYRADGGGSSVNGWPVRLDNATTAYPSVGPVNATQNGVWIADLGTLEAFNGKGEMVYQQPLAAEGPGTWGSFAAPTIADLGHPSSTGRGTELSVVTVDQTTQDGYLDWGVREFGIPSTRSMLAGACPQFHCNAQETGMPLAAATLNPIHPAATETTVSWTPAANSPAAGSYALWADDTTNSSGWVRYTQVAGSVTRTLFDGVPGHTYALALQVGSQVPDLASGTVTAYFGNVTASHDVAGLYGVDGYGRLLSGSSPPVHNQNSWTWNVARGLAVGRGGQGGYILDAFGGVESFGNAPALCQGCVSGYWQGWDIARSITLRADGVSGYVLDGFGGLWPFGPAGDRPPSVTVTGYWSYDIARDVALLPDGHSGYVLDGYGGIHPFGVNGDMPPAVTNTGWWSGWDIAHRFVLDSTGDGGYVMDGYGGLWPFGTTPSTTPAAPAASGYWRGWDIARGVVLAPNQPDALSNMQAGAGWVMDSWGGMHAFGAASGNLATPVTAINATAGDTGTQLAVASGALTKDMAGRPSVGRAPGSPCAAWATPDSCRRSCC